MTTEARATTRGRSGWMRTMVLTVGIVLLSMALLPPAARAETNQGGSASAAFLAQLCKAGGGIAAIVDAPGWTVVHCYGGVYGGMDCFFGPQGTFCTGAYPHPVSRVTGTQIWPIDEVLPVLENGSPAQLGEILDDVAAGTDPEPGASPSVVSPDDQHQDQDHDPGKGKSKGKKGKHGKKGGKGRK